MRSSVLALSLLLWPLALQAGEVRYLYEVSWLGLRAGKIELRVREGEGFRRLEARSRTVGMARLVFPFESRWVTWCDASGYPRRSRLYRRRGKKEVVKFFVFDQRRGVVWRVKVKKGRRKLGRYRLSHHPVYDELSGFVACTARSWTRPGERTVVWIYAHKRAAPAEIVFRGWDRVEAPWGRVRAAKLEVRFGFESELVKRARRALLWVHRGIVLRAEGELPFGHLTVKLKEVKDDHAQAQADPGRQGPGE